VRDVKEASSGISSKIEAGIAIEAVSVSANHGLESKVSAIDEETTEQKIQQREEKLKISELLETTK